MCIMHAQSQLFMASMFSCAICCLQTLNELSASHRYAGASKLPVPHVDPVTRLVCPRQQLWW